MLKCPYCFEEIQDAQQAAGQRCPHCNQYIIDDLIKSDFSSIDKKKCIFCGNMICTEAKICKFCHKWLDEVDRTVNDLNFDDLYED